MVLPDVPASEPDTILPVPAEPPSEPETELPPAVPPSDPVTVLLDPEPAESDPVTTEAEATDVPAMASAANIAVLARRFLIVFVMMLCNVRIIMN
jgi:hypothetical protein